MSRVPRIFHFVFGLKPQTEPFHVAHYLALASCLQVNRPARVLLHYRHQPYGRWWERIRSQLELHRLPSSPAPFAPLACTDPNIRAYDYAHQADFVRLEVLLRHGGVYADIDTIFFVPYPERLFAHPCVLGHETPFIAPGATTPVASLCNAVIFAEPGAVFIQRWIASMSDAFDGSWSAHSCQLPATLAARHPATIHLEPQGTFYPWMYARADLRALLEENAPMPRGACSAHLWQHLWWSPERLDFSRFNHELLTESHVRRGRTTYARLARRFLPPASAMTLRERFDRLRDPLRALWGRRHHYRGIARAYARLDKNSINSCRTK